MDEYGEHVRGPGQRVQDTTLEGYELALGDIQRREAEVMNVVRSREGATLFEMAADLGRPMHALSGRVRRLTQVGRLRDSGARRVNPASGVNGIVWVERKDLISG